MNYSKAGIGGDRIIPTQVRNEKEAALCRDSPTNVHFFLIRYDHVGQLVSTGTRLVCEVCGQPIKQDGARWVLDVYVIDEADDIEDFL